MALIVFASTVAEGQMGPVHRMLPDRVGDTIIQNNLLVIRVLADNSFALRRTLMPILCRLNSDTLPRFWML